MQPFTTLESIAAPLDRANVDTDVIIPARVLVQPRSAGLGNFAFHDLRFDEDGAERPEFTLNQAPYRDARILVADDNFGCGSSRESAVWALVDYHHGDGFRAIIAPRFGDIFYNNCCKNGVLPIRLDADTVAELRRQLHAKPGAKIAIDLPAQTMVAPAGQTHKFDIDPFRKECLVEGLDDIDLTMRHEAEIEAYERDRRQHVPWSIP